jgi:hypothetical protein
MWDDAGAGFFDRAADGPPPPSMPALPLKPFVLNCEAAVVLRRLADALGDPVFDRRARETLDAAGARAAGFGPLAAHYLIARRAVLR